MYQVLIRRTKKELFLFYFFYQLGIPRHYMAQIQGQLAITGLPWCNFLAVCKNSKEIMLKKVYFHSEYWNNAVKILKQFCFALQVSLLLWFCIHWSARSLCYIFMKNDAEYFMKKGFHNDFILILKNESSELLSSSTVLKLNIFFDQSIFIYLISYCDPLEYSCYRAKFLRNNFKILMAFCQAQVKTIYSY